MTNNEQPHHDFESVHEQLPANVHDFFIKKNIPLEKGLEKWNKLSLKEKSKFKAYISKINLKSKTLTS